MNIKRFVTKTRARTERIERLTEKMNTTLPMSKKDLSEVSFIFQRVTLDSVRTLERTKN